MEHGDISNEVVPRLALVFENLIGILPTKPEQARFALYRRLRQPKRATKVFQVKITNPYTFSIRVPALTATVAARTTKVGCTGAKTNIVVTTKGMRAVVIPKRTSRYATIHVTMPSTVANACQGARFTITLRGRATRA